MNEFLQFCSGGLFFSFATLMKYIEFLRSLDTDYCKHKFMFGGYCTEFWRYLRLEQGAQKMSANIPYINTHPHSLVDECLMTILGFTIPFH